MEKLEGIYQSKSKAFLAFCFCFICGVGISSGAELEKFWLYRFYILFFIIGCGVIIFWGRRPMRFGLLCALFFVLGALRFLITIPGDDGSQMSFYNGEHREIFGVVAGAPNKGMNGTSYVFKTDQGKVLLKLPNYPAYKSGDYLKIQCLLQSPKNFPGSNFRYDNYLARLGIWSICSAPKIIAFTPSARANILFTLKEKMNRQVERLWSEPRSSLMAGILYGERGGFDQELLDNFSRVGITHIIAISGYNISVLAVVMMIVLIRLGLYRQQAFWICVVGIILFVLFTGASASVVRAGIMGVIVLIAQQLGRLSRVGNAIACTAAVMLLINPYVLVWDAGFQLSFLATLGLIYLSPSMEKILADYIKWPIITEILATTLSAIIITLPLILYQFGRLSLVAPITNILILWIIPWLMLFGFLSVMISWVVWPLGLVLAWVAGVGLNYVIIIAEWLGRKGWSAITWGVPFWGMLAMYLLIIILIDRYAKQNKNFVVR